MEHSLTLLPFIAMLWGVFVGLSQGIDINGILVQGTSISSSSGGSSLASMPCVQKLLPCQEYLKAMAAAGPPAPTCCLPLKEVISDDSKCLCDVFNNADFLKGLNITQDDALRLPKACGANADHVSVCKKDAASSTGSAATRNNSSATSASSSSSDTSTSAKNIANAISYLAGTGFAAGFLSLIVSVF